MILPSFVLNSKIQKKSNVANELDQKENCIDPDHYDRYPWPVTYQYNSRGYRDQEWPSDLQNAIWCFGDSFTVGLGSPQTHTWCHCLQKRSGQRVINISMDGASNNWIARKIQELLIEIVPRTIVIQWSYAHRRESDVDYVRKLIFFDLCQSWDKFYADIRDPSWPEVSLFDFYKLPQWIQDEIHNFDFSGNDQKLTQWLEIIHSQQYYIDDETRRMHYDRNALIQDDINNTIWCINQVESAAAKHGVTVIHSFIPDFIDDKYWKSISHCVPMDRCVGLFKKLDLARDSLHYDIVTATYVSEQIDFLMQSTHATSQTL